MMVCLGKMKVKIQNVGLNALESCFFQKRNCNKFDFS
jgi:hypothetical protein